MELSNAKEEELAKQEMSDDSFANQENIQEESQVEYSCSGAGGSRWTAFLPPNAHKYRSEEEANIREKTGFAEPCVKKSKLEIMSQSSVGKGMPLSSQKNFSSNAEKQPVTSHTQPSQSKWSKFVG